MGTNFEVLEQIYQKIIHYMYCFQYFQNVMGSLKWITGVQHNSMTEHQKELVQVLSNCKIHFSVFHSRWIILVFIFPCKKQFGKSHTKLMSGSKVGFSLQEIANFCQIPKFWASLCPILPYIFYLKNTYLSSVNFITVVPREEKTMKDMRSMGLWGKRKE